MKHLSHANPVDDMAEAMQKTVRYIEQLCSMVNNYSGQLGLGRKVRSEDFTEELVDALKRAGFNAP